MEGGDTGRFVYGDLCGGMKFLVLKHSVLRSLDSFFVSVTVLRENAPQIFERWQLFITNKKRQVKLVGHLYSTGTPLLSLWW